MPGLSEVQAPLVIVVGIVGYVLPVEIRDVVALELDEPPTLQHVESADHARAAKVERADSAARPRPPGCSGQPSSKAASVSADDLADRRLDRGSVPRLLDERLVALGIEERQR